MFSISKRIATVFLFLTVPAFSQAPATPQDHHKLVRLEGIEVAGTRFPQESIIKISGLKIGQMINDETLKEASGRLTSTGLIKGIDYGYNIVPGRPGVLLSMKVFDEGPLLPVRILPESAAEPIWNCLRSADPIFTAEMPNTERAIHFYSVNIARCVEKSGAPKARVSAVVACDGTGKSISIDFHVSALDSR